MIEELPGRGPRLPLHARARPPRALRPALEPAARRAAPARGRGARGRRRAVRRELADLAHHFAAAAPLGGARARRSPTTCSRPGRRARGLAFDEAAARLRTALELGIDDPAERAETYLELGTASHRAGRALDALDAFSETAAIARELGRRQLLARAAIGYEDACWRPGIADQGAAELLEEAADGARRRATRSCACGCSAGSRGRSTSAASTTRAAIVRTNAIEMARSLDDRAGLATVLMRSYWSRGTAR